MMCDEEKTGAVCFGQTDFMTAVQQTELPVEIVYDAQMKRTGVRMGSGEMPSTLGGAKHSHVLAALPALSPACFGNPAFKKDHNVRYAYVGGAMARGIASVDTVIALAKNGMFGFFGSAGLSSERVESELIRIKDTLDPLGLPWGSNLIHSPDMPALERAITELYIKMGVARVSASAFMRLSENVVHYTSKGLYRNAEGKVCRKHYLFAKVSRPEIAKHFLAPAPEKILRKLCADGRLTEEEAALAREASVAQEIIVEADSGGHTDNRPLPAVFPRMLALKDEMQKKYPCAQDVRLGAAGGLGTPEAVAGAFALGADFVLTGSVHQGCVESGLCDEGKALLAKMDMADVIMAISADMFERGVRVQVLKKGTMFGVRANKLYDIYRRYPSIEALPEGVVADIEKNIFKTSLADIWAQTQAFWQVSNPYELEKASENPQKKMALMFRWYVGNASRWAIVGEADRVTDYQIWVGPAMGAFNAWVKGSFLEAVENRTIKQVALNMLQGAAQVTRAQQLRHMGVWSPHITYCPIPLEG